MEESRKGTSAALLIQTALLGALTMVSVLGFVAMMVTVPLAV
jgi:hypothetical protein